jgi:hypothetical protein
MNINNKKKSKRSNQYKCFQWKEKVLKMGSFLDPSSKGEQMEKFLKLLFYLRERILEA